MNRFKGLTQREVRERRRAGLVNISVEAPSKSVKDIIISNIFTYFNFIFFFLAILLLLVGLFRETLFLVVVVANTLIGIIQELYAKSVLDKLTILHTPKARVIRDGRQQVIPVEKLVLDDYVVFKTGDQIPADAKIVDGEVAVNEALLTGEADEILKSVDDELMSGSFIIYGNCVAKLTKVGADSYASQLTLKAKAIKTGEQSEITKSLNNFVRLVGIAIVPIAIIMFSQQFFLNDQPVSTSVQGMVAAVVGMIPEGLFLLASVTLALSAVRLATNQVMLHDMKSIETLARVDTLCVDKTGTITTDEMNVIETIPLVKNNAKLLPVMIAEVVANLAADNATMKALKKQFKRKAKEFRLDDYEHVIEVVPFSSKYKFSGVQFEKSAYVIGAPEFIMKDNFKSVRSEVNKWSLKGYRVLLFGRYNGKLHAGEGLENTVTPLALVILENEIRETAPATFKYFAEQGVEVKVISGDNPVTVSEVAKKVGIVGAEKFVDATKLGSGKDFEKAVLENVVFGRVTPDLKRRIINILKDNGHTVAMTGDGVNDVLALKDADCSVAMASGSQAAVQASQVVLLESDFSKMPNVVREGRRVVNNLERSGSLFIVKNLFSLIAAAISICFAFVYPMRVAQVSFVTMFTIGVPSFLLAQIPNERLIKGNFLKNIITVAAPTAITNVILIMLTTVICNIINMPADASSTLCALVWAIVGIVHLFRVCRPFNTIKAIIFGVCFAGIIVFCLTLDWLYGLDFNFGLEGWILFAVMAVVSYPTILLIQKFVAWLDNIFVTKYMEKWSKRMDKVNDNLDKFFDTIKKWFMKLVSRK